MLQQMLGRAQQGAGPVDETAMLPDTAEQVQVSSLALLKMLRHGRAGVPMEVMGLMLGEMVDDYTIKVVDVFAMPQTGTASSPLVSSVVLASSPLVSSVVLAFSPLVSSVFLR